MESENKKKKGYIKPVCTSVHIGLIDELSDSFSIGGQMLTGSVKDKSSGISGVKEESIFDDNDNYTTSDIWDDEW